MWSTDLVPSSKIAAACFNERVIPTRIEVGPEEARKRFFLEKEAKTFVHWGTRWI
jgi:hypothetical protein